MIRRVSPYLRYLAIPTGYGPTDGLRWANNGEAVETADGRTFIISAALPPFLEGFASQRPLIHIVYLLDLLDLLGQRDAPWDGMPRRLCMTVRDVYRSEGTPLRNAGALFGGLCRDVPSAYLPGTDDVNVAKWLAALPSLVMKGWENPERPPLDPAAFHRLVCAKLEKIPEEELRHWFKFGRPPVMDAGERLAEEIADAKPPAQHGTLEELLRRQPRLAGALPLVGAMLSALTLPPRRRRPPEMPLGGYADVTTRGEPERLLPSQFALDADEFVRRFAEKELLFFRKEEPHQRTRERLVLLVDQGVRTWGVVRLALAAAALAFHQLADRKKRPFLIRFSSAAGERLDPSEGDPQPFVDRLAASDFTPNPADLLDAEFNAGDEEEADIVLLTHPRSLRDDGIKSALPRLPAQQRLFALAVDDEGAAQFSHLRGSEAVPITRFRVNFHEPEVAPKPLPRDTRMWSGAVEPVPFPFPIGPFKKIVAVGFDADSLYLLVATQKGYLHLYALENGKLELLPRAVHNGRALETVEAILGLHGGFALGGRVDGVMVVAHYDIRDKSVKLHALGPAAAAWSAWHVFPDYNSVAVRQVAVCRGLDLDTGAIYAEPERIAPAVSSQSISHVSGSGVDFSVEPPTVVEISVPAPSGGSPRAHLAYLKALETETPSPWLPIQPVGFALPAKGNGADFLAHDKRMGRLSLKLGGLRSKLAPESDGKRLFADVDIDAAQVVRATLAVRSWHKGLGRRWHLLDVKEPANVMELVSPGAGDSVSRLSHDGRRFAHWRNTCEMAVYALFSATPAFVAAPARVHNNLAVFLDETSLKLVVGRKQHVLSWKYGPLEHRFERIPLGAAIGAKPIGATRDLSHPFMKADPLRFTAMASVDVDVLVDLAGQVIVRDFHRDQLVCIFFPRRDQLAAWMPDGTRYGPSDLTGGPATPDALERLGAALRHACSPME